MRRSIPVILLGSLLLVAGCTADPEPSPSGSSSPSPSASDSGDAVEGAVTVESEHFGAGVTLTVHPMEVTGDAGLLTIDVSMADDAPDETPKIVMSELFGNLTGGTQLGRVRVLDLEAGQVWWPAQDAAGTVLTSRDGTVVTPGETATGLLAFALPGDADAVDVLLPYFGLVPDVPVVDAGAEAEDALTELGVAADSTYPTATLEAFTAAYDNAARASVEGEQAVVTLASDVLFATNEFVLTDAAAQVVDTAAGQIAAASPGGEVSVIGHTDDVGSDASNQELSVRRAESVAARLGPALGPGYTVRTEGRGESEPAVPGQSAEARAANRRVEIRFTAQDPGQAIDVGTTAMPDPTGAVGSGTETVAAAAADGKEYDVAAVSVERRGDYLIGTLSVTRTTEGRDGPIQTLLGPVPPGPSSARNFPETSLQAGAFGVSLLGEGSRFLPIDYTAVPAEGTTPAQRQVLADTAVAVTRVGEPTLITVVWPDTGQDTVTIDVQDRFRITDVPVEG